MVYPYGQGGVVEPLRTFCGQGEVFNFSRFVRTSFMDCPLCVNDTEGMYDTIFQLKWKQFFYLTLIEGILPILNHLGN